MRTFQYSDAKSHKFWNIDVSGNSFTVTYGKVGTAGQTQTKAFPTPAKAQEAADKLTKEKTAKGYAETSLRGNASEVEAFEKAIQNNPRDLAGVAAYADYLAEHDDPRGEFMQTQIALESESLPKAERKNLHNREVELLGEHEAEWVGDWATHPDVGQATDEWVAPKGWVPYRFTRGLLSSVELGGLTVDVARKVVKAPQLRFVTELTVHDIAYEEEYEDGPDLKESDGEEPSQYILVRWPQLRHLRVFRFGGCDPEDYDSDWCPYRSHTPGILIADFAKQMPHVEELHIMAHFREEAERLVSLRMPELKVLLLYHGWNYPLDKLAKNASLTNLRELRCHPHALEGGDEPYIRLPHLRAVCRSKFLTSFTHLQLRLANFGDKGIDEIVSSGILKRLKVLDLRHGTVTDEGAKALAACPDVKNLGHLDLSWNRLTAVGVKALTATKVKATLNRQQRVDGDDWECFGQGDIE